MSRFWRGVVRALDVQMTVAHDPLDKVRGGNAVNVLNPVRIGRAEVLEITTQHDPGLIVGNPQA